MAEILAILIGGIVGVVLIAGFNKTQREQAEIEKLMYGDFESRYEVNDE